MALIKKFAKTVVNHPSLVVIPALFAGVAAAHPIRNMDHQIGQSFENDPNAPKNFIHNAVRANLGPEFQQVGQPGFGANILSTGNTAGITTSNQEFSANPNPDQQLRMSEGSGANPNGSLVFGLYQNRQR